MIKAIIFDLGGVYFSAGTEIAYKRLVKEFPNIKPNKILGIIRTDKITKDYRLGRYTKKEFWKKAKKFAGTGFDAKKFSKIWNSSYTLNRDVAKISLRLKKNYKIAVLSGNIRERIKYLDHIYNFKKNFDVFVCSYMLNANKPDKKIYLEVLRRLKLKGDECVFIDNNRKNIRAAERLGMKAVYFKNAKQLKKELAFI